MIVALLQVNSIADIIPHLEGMPTAELEKKLALMDAYRHHMLYQVGKRNVLRALLPAIHLCIHVCLLYLPLKYLAIDRAVEWSDAFSICR